VRRPNRLPPGMFLLISSDERENRASLDVTPNSISLILRVRRDVGVSEETDISG
jgi:hypothetical protein